MKRISQFYNFMLFGVFLFAYIFLFLYALIFKNVSPLELFDTNREFVRSVNAIPFRTIYSYITGSNAIIAASNILGNIILFVPLGIYLQLLNRAKKIWTSMLIIILTTLFVEIFQFVFGLGVVDIDDIILNSLGGLIGIFVYRGLHALLKNEGKVRITIVISGFVLILIYILVPMILGLKLRLI